MERKDKVEGEGSYSGTKDYNERTRKFMEQGKVDDAARRRCDVAEGVHVRHDVVAEPLFVRGDRGEVDVVEVRAHVSECRFRNVSAEGALRLGERQPEPAPEAIARRGRPQVQHGGRGVSLGQRGAPRRGVGHRIWKSIG